MCIRDRKKVALREGDTLVIPSLDHLSDHKETVQKELQWLRDSDIRLKVLDMPTTMVDFPEDQAWAARLINDVLIETFNATVAQEYTEHKQKQREEMCIRDSCRTGGPESGHGYLWTSFQSFSDIRLQPVTSCVCGNGCASATPI